MFSPAFVRRTTEGFVARGGGVARNSTKHDKEESTF